MELFGVGGTEAAALLGTGGFFTFLIGSITLFVTGRREKRSTARELNRDERKELLEAYVKVEAALSKHISKKVTRQVILDHAYNVEHEGAQAILVGHPQIEVEIKRIIQASIWYTDPHDPLEVEDMYLKYGNALQLHWDNLKAIMRADLARQPVPNNLDQWDERFEGRNLDMNEY